MNNEFHQSDSRPAATRRIGWIAWILIPAILGAVIGAGVAARTKPLYRSDTRILVVPQRIPESVRAIDSHHEAEGSGAIHLATNSQ